MPNDLGAHFFEAAQQELAETARLFDLSEHWLGQLLAQPVGARVPAGLDLREIAGGSSTTIGKASMRWCARGCGSATNTCSRISAGMWSS
jgi:hypothetical protein